MIPLQQLLSRIRWDKKFGFGVFEIGYYDRLRKEIVRVPFSEIMFSEESRGSIRIMDREGGLQTVPFHRIREVYKDKELIWYRPFSAENRQK